MESKLIGVRLNPLCARTGLLYSTAALDSWTIYTSLSRDWRSITVPMVVLHISLMSQNVNM